MLLFLLLLTLLLTAALPPNALAADPQRLTCAFGLFSVALPSGMTPGPNTADGLSDERYSVDENNVLIRVNYAPISEYAHTAQRAMDSYISFMFVMLHTDYSESPVAEEVLDGGVRIRWQVMRSAQGKAMWFEAFTERYGYNFCVSGISPETEDEALAEIARSIRIDPQIEADVAEFRQTPAGDGAFISVDHALRIQLTPQWNPVPFMCGPGTAFALEQGDGQLLIEVIRLKSMLPDDLEDRFDSIIAFRRQQPNMGSATWSEKKMLPLPNLGEGAEAFFIECETGGDSSIFMQHIGFLYQGYPYYGAFMWIAPLDGERRAEMEEAIQSLSPAQQPI